MLAVTSEIRREGITVVVSAPKSTLLSIVSRILDLSDATFILFYGDKGCSEFTLNCHGEVKISYFRD